jgi:hypothetical protein
MRSTLLALLLSLSLGAATASEATGQAAGPAGRGSELSVYLMTMGPGTHVWERFGHNAIRVRDELRGTDVAYNYGMFSFEQDRFILRFIRGHMDYWMEGFDAFQTASAYVRDDRSVWIQELNLSPSQRADLRDFLEWNARPENRFYRYEYFRDNCSTRVRDAIDLVLGGQIRARTGAIGSGTTYREHTRSLTADDLLIYTGLMAGLGQPVDREISVWEEMFLPMRLRDHFRELTIDDASGRPAPLVLSEEEIYRSVGAAEGGEPPSRLPHYLGTGLVLAVLVGASARFAGRRRDARAGLSLLAGVWCSVAGFLGVVLFGLWAWTDHAASARNENLLFFNPALLPLAVLMPLAASGSERARAAVVPVAGAVAVLSLLALLLRPLPWFHQVNLELMALALPVNLSLAYAAWELRRGAGAGSPDVAGAVEPGAETAPARV